MDGKVKGLRQKTVVTEKDEVIQSYEATEDGLNIRSDITLSVRLPRLDLAMTDKTDQEEEAKSHEETTRTALDREYDTRSVTFDNSRCNGHNGEHDLSSSELCVSSDALAIDKEIARRNAEATEDILNSGDYSCETNASLTDFYTIELQRARTNTPTSTYCTDITECKPTTKKSQPSDDSTNKSAIYQKAITLMTERCGSTATGNRRNCGSASNEKQPFVIQTPEFFYVQQTKPTPMTPLQAWRGYHGNIYFEPIKVQPARYSVPEQQELPLDKCSDQLRSILKRSRRVQSSRSMPLVPAGDREYVSIKPLARSMTNLGRNSARSKDMSSAQKGHRKMAVLDKRMVFSENNENIHEDIIWIVGQESTGSLFLDGEVADTIQRSERTPSRFNHQRRQNGARQPQPASGQQKKNGLDKERICRGSVVRRTRPLRSDDRPAFAVTGSRLIQQQAQSSPLLRTQTQYSHSNQRCLNSPDIFCGLDKLPPLEQLRASLRHIEPDRRTKLTHVVAPLDRMRFEDTESMTKKKPFIKYSPEVTNNAKFRNEQMSRQQQQVM